MAGVDSDALPKSDTAETDRRRTRVVGSGIDVDAFRTETEVAVVTAASNCSPAEAATGVTCVVDARTGAADRETFVHRLRTVVPSLPLVVVVDADDDPNALLDAGGTDYLRLDDAAPTTRLLATRVRSACAHARPDPTESPFGRAVEEAGHSIYITDRNGVIEYVNPAFEETTGYDVTEAVGRTPRLLKSGIHDAAFYRDLWETILNGDVWRSQITNRRKDGEEYHVRQTIAPIPDESGDIVRFVAVNDDVTEERERERLLERQNERLNEFAGIVSHDLRNPLQVAMGNLSLARETGDEERFDSVERALDRMHELTDTLLDVAQSGVLIREREAVAIADVARAAWTTTDTEDATLVVDTTRTVVADESCLRQLFENLFRNAVEHAGPTTTVLVGDANDRFYVEDDGDGVPPEDRDEVFDRGERGRASDGHGLGLAIVANIAEAHGWSVDLSNGENGARFEIETQ